MRGLPMTVNIQPTALSGRRRHAIRPHAANETPESVWITMFPGTGGPVANNTGISATTLAHATAAQAASQNAAPCVGAVNRLSRWARTMGHSRP